MPIYCQNIVLECDYCMREETLQPTEFATGHPHSCGLEHCDIPEGWHVETGVVACPSCLENKS